MSETVSLKEYVDKRFDHVKNESDERDRRHSAEVESVKEAAKLALSAADKASEKAQQTQARTISALAIIVTIVVAASAYLSRH